MIERVLMLRIYRGICICKKNDGKKLLFSYCFKEDKMNTNLYQSVEFINNYTFKNISKYENNSRIRKTIKRTFNISKYDNIVVSTNPEKIVDCGGCGGSGRCCSTNPEKIVDCVGCGGSGCGRCC